MNNINMERIHNLARAYRTILENDYLSLTGKTKRELYKREKTIKKYLKERFLERLNRDLV